MKEAGIKNKKEFYSKYPDKESFFKDYPHMRTGGSYTWDTSTNSSYKAGGQLNVEQNQALPEDRSIDNKFRNVIEKRGSGNKRPSQVPFPIQSGAYTDVPQTLKKGGQYSGTYDLGTNGYYQEGGTMIDEGTGKSLYKKSSKYKPLKQEGGECPECEEMKKGGHWIQDAIKHPGRCTPGSPNYDCPKGSPQWRLTQTFKKHHGFHKKEDGGETSEEESVKKAPPVAINYNTGNDPYHHPNINYGQNQPGVTRQKQNISYIPQAAMHDMPVTHPQQMSNDSEQETGQQSNPHYGLSAIASAAGLFSGIGYMMNQNQKTRNYQNYLMQHGQTNDMYYPTPGSKGEIGISGQGYGQMNLTGPTGAYGFQNAGYFAPQMMAQQGGMMLREYEVGGEYDISDEEIARLQKLGYKIQKM